MSTVKKVLNLPIPSSGCGDIRITADACDLIAEFEYYSKDRKDMIGQLRFSNLNAFWFKDEKHILNYGKGAYDCVIEISDSDVIKQLYNVEPAGISIVKKNHHYAVFFSSNGYLEVIADSCELCDSKEGQLSDFP